MTKRTRYIALAVISLGVLVPLAVASAQTTKTTKGPEAGPSGGTVSADTGTPGKTTETGSKLATTGPEQQAPSASPFGGNGMMIWGLFALIILMFWWSSRSKKKQEQKHRDMLSALKKGDKITTIGGIIGTVIEVRDDEVVVKVDETNNVRMRFIRGAIRDVGQGAAKSDALEQKK